MKDKDNLSIKFLLGAALFMAGLLTMTYEVSWHRLLSLWLGATLRSATIVLSVFMLGMGFGAWFFGRMADGSSRPARQLAWLHWAMALSGAWGLGLLSLIPRISGSLGGQATILGETAVHLTAVMALLPGAAAAGGMVPVTARAYITGRESLSSGIGTLYALEALGSVAGGAAAGYLMIRFWGQMNTLIFALAVNIAIGAALYFLAGKCRGESDRMRISGQREDGKRRNWDVLLIALAIGLVGMGLQVVWNRAVRIYLPNSSYTFATVASVYLAGLFAGSLIFRIFEKHIGDRQGWLWAGLLALGATVATGALFLEHIPRLILFPSAGLLSSPAARAFLPPLLVTLSLAIVPTVILGFCSPLACRIFAERTSSVGRDVGLLRAANILGSAMGPAAAGLLLIPLAGVSRSLWLFTGLSAAASLAAACLPPRRKIQASLSLAGALICLLMAVFLKPAMILPPSMHDSGQAMDSRNYKIIHYRETSEGTVIVTEDRYTGIRACYVNNSGVVGTTYDAIKAVKMLGHLPFLCGAEPKRALVIGFGIGVTAATVASHPAVERVDCVEITPGVRRAAAFFKEFNRNVADNPKIRFIDGDGRTFLNRTEERYDLISADPTHPTLGCSQLYTREYFQLCRQRLSRDGIICQYLPFHGLTPEEFLGAIATFASVFPHSSLWLGHSHGVLLGSKLPLSADFPAWQRRAESIKDPLFYKDPYALAACLLLDEEGIARLAKNKRICTDDRNYLEFFNPGAKSPANWERNIGLVIVAAGLTPAFFAEVDDGARLERYRAGQMLFIKGMIGQNRKDREGMIRFMQEAVRVVPENEEFRFLLQQELRRMPW